MSLRIIGAVFSVLLALPAPLLAAVEPPVNLPWWSATPFVLLLLAIAILPLVREHFWEKNRNRALVTAAISLPTVVYLWLMSDQTGGRTVDLLVHELQQYGSFILLLGSLYVVSGGIILRGDLRASPLTNGSILAVGAVLANLIGTTGASMLLIRPILRINQARRRRSHIPIFFIFMVSNLGGLLTPLGDPPLFLAFLNGVNFGWTLRLWPQWLIVNSFVLCVFLIWDGLTARKESPANLADPTPRQGLSLGGKINFLFLSGIVLAAIFQAGKLADFVQAQLNHLFPCPPLQLHRPWPEAIMAAMALLSLICTPRGLRADNRFGWAPILEVAILFAGIFVTMVPALELLKANGGALGLNEPWHYFWITGTLSSFLDNAPTYMVFATVASRGAAFDVLVNNAVAELDGPRVLAAISCAAVFMGANTYIGNGPNFMVKAIADQSGYRMPSFLGYMLYSGLILLPIFVIITLVFFV